MNFINYILRFSFSMAKRFMNSLMGEAKKEQIIEAFVTLYRDDKDIIRAGKYYGVGLTNTKAESFALPDALDCLSNLLH